MMIKLIKFVYCDLLIYDKNCHFLYNHLLNIKGPYALLQKHTSEITPEDIELATTILNRYCGPLEDLSMDKFDNFTKMADDSFFLYGIYKLLDLHMKQSTGNTYYYRMKYYVRILL